MPPREEKEVVLRDGVRLKYYIIHGEVGAPVMVFAAGLSCASTFHLWAAPVVHRFGARYSYIYWEYRGLFHSDRPKRPRRLAIPEHAEDLHEILRQEGIACIDVLIGHSMGCQVTLEFALLYPEQVDKIVLSNGGHGRICSSFLQPLVRVPGARQFFFLLTRLTVAIVGPFNDKLVTNFTESWFFHMLRRFVRLVFQVYGAFFGSPLLWEVIGPTYLQDFFESYIVEFFSSAAHLDSLVHLIWELEGHSVFHLLPEIKQPVLILTGIFDPVIPAYQGFEMAELLPNCRHVWLTTSAHVAFLDAPGVSCRELERFLASRTRGLRFRRVSSSYAE